MFHEPLPESAASLRGMLLVEELLQAYDAPQCPEFQKAYLFGLFHRGRFHTSAVLGLHPHWPWPIVPYLDTHMLDLIGGMPYEHMRHRRMQYHMLRVRFPELARLPLDRNGFNTRPVLPRFNRYAEYAWHKLLSSGREAVSRVRDGRFYYRVMDFNSAGWRLVRAAAEKHRTQAARHLNAATLARLLPRPMPRSWPRTPSAMRPRRGC